MFHFHRLRDSGGDGDRTKSAGTKKVGNLGMKWGMPLNESRNHPLRSSVRFSRDILVRNNLDYEWPKREDNWGLQIG